LDKEGREGARAFFLEAWNGCDRFTYDRIGRGTVEIEAACVSVLGGIQPGPLSDYMVVAANGGMGDDGLLQRFQLLVWPDVSGWTNVDRRPDAQAQAAAWDVFARLDGIDPAGIRAQAESEGDIPWLRFNDEAQAEFNDWRAALEKRIRYDGEPPAFEAHLAKYRSLVPSLSLLIHLAENPNGGPVPHSCLLRALAWVEYLESHARRVYAQTLSPELAAAVELYRHILRGDLPSGFAKRDVYRKCRRRLDQEGTTAALQVLEDLDRVKGTDTTTSAGRPTTRYTVNPKLKGGAS